MDKKTYTIAKSKNKAEVGYVDSYSFGCTYRPKTEFRLWHKADEGFFIEITCHEKSPRATYKNMMDPVYKDSCMEFFVCFYPNLPYANYINFEMNANGALLVNYHKVEDENKKIACHQHFNGYVKPTVEKQKWSVELFIPLEFINKVYGDIPLGNHFLGNVYKCGDDTAIPHYGSWNKVVWEKPNFHLPQFFGNLVLDV